MKRQARKERDSGASGVVRMPSHVGNFEMKTIMRDAGEVRGRGKAEQETRTRVATGRWESSEEKERRETREKATKGGTGRGTTGVKARLEGVEERVRESRVETREENFGGGVENRADVRVRCTGAETGGATAVITCRLEGGGQQRVRGIDSREETGEEKGRGTDNREGEEKPGFT